MNAIALPRPIVAFRRTRFYGRWHFRLQRWRRAWLYATGRWSRDDASYSSDELRELPSAPDWIRNWPGPFRVEVEDSIRNYFGED